MSVYYEEVVYLEIETPTCWGYCDPKDLSCAKCPVVEYCKDEQAETRPECFGVARDESNEECARCLDESQCANKLQIQGDEIMSKTAVVRRKKRPVRRKPPAAVEEQEVQEVEAKPAPKKPARRRKAPVKAKPQPKAKSNIPEVADDSDYDEWETSELRAELKERGLATRGRSAVLIQRLVDNDNADEGEDEPEPVKAKPAARRGRRKAKPVAEPEEDEGGLSMDATMVEFLESVGIGQSVVATRIDDDTWQFVIGVGVAAAVAAPVGMGLKGMAYKKEVLSEEYWQHNYEDAGNGKGWKKMTPEEKYEFADELGVSWEESEDPKVDMMRCVKAVYLELGISKYKEEYKTTSARNSVR